LTTFLATQWTTPLAVSDPGVDSRNPRLGVQFDGSIRIEYDTPDGTEARVVSLVSPASIVAGRSSTTVVRRSTARTRDTTSRGENGFAT